MYSYFCFKETTVKKLENMNIAILIANGFEQIEMELPRRALEEVGATTIIISSEKKEVQGWQHFEKGDKFQVDLPITDANAADFDALLLPGGVVNPDTLRTVPEAIKFISDMYKKNKPIAAICHGPWTLIDAGAVHGHKVTSWPSIKTDLINAGAEWIDEPVVYDRTLVTSRKPADIPQFNKAMIELFASHKARI